MGEHKAVKYDPNTEAFQMRAQWKKQDNCRQQWFERWSWLLDERKQALAEAEAIRQEASSVTRSQVTMKIDDGKSLKPVPLTSTGVIGWLASRPDCRLEIYTSWLTKPPIKLPDAWDNPHYMGKKK
ncbi:hypothetical protein SFRURICE_006428 [Spodoptera frugiperda]|uniref:SFRICE_006280 n=1 Tax=Spodoptera frugiperda TaxID=7108 RepID=A0A2H1VF73_SPOFR|nr:uncharacterized protein LOC118266875 [Spodoptera frugiperda]KAF9799168.1 hypothetical protein SFRURICE_006428 [Spodoptera frugiperda]